MKWCINRFRVTDLVSLSGKTPEALGEEILTRLASWGRSGWQMGIGLGLGISGAITLTGCFAIALPNTPAFAQITPDATLGAESSQVTSPIPRGFLINGGATRGTNLFHSFSQFSVPTNGFAYFNNAINIQNIITRVTGTSVSNIDGFLAANGTANLFLINPNGILFGPNARLSLGGSFFASTASSVVFANGNQFSATNPQTPPLLTISVPLGLQYGSNAGSIQAQGSRLQVPNGQTLALVGGNIQFNRASLFAPGGRVELGGLSEPGIVGLNIDGNNLRLGFPNNIARADISLTNGSSVNVIAGGGGNIAINSRNLNIAGGSTINAGIGAGLGTVNSKAGNIEINATDTITLDGTNSANASSGIKNGLLLGSGTSGDIFIAFSTVEQGAVGNGNDIEINTGSLSITNGAAVSASTLGEGKGGSLIVNASQGVQLIGTSTDGQFRSGLFALTSGKGDGGNVQITTPWLLVSDGAAVNVNSYGEGKGGSLIVNASQTVQLMGTSADGQFSSGLFAGTSGKGDGGNVEITTPELLVKDGAEVNVSTYSKSKGGSLIVNASQGVQLIGTSADGQFSSGLGALTSGKGNGGNVQITTPQLLVKDGAEVSVSTYGEGQGGSLIVNASQGVQLIGTSADGHSPSALVAVTLDKGDGGNVQITTPWLLVKDGADVNVSTQGEGKGGSLIVNASQGVQLIGTSADSQSNSGLFAETSGKGDGGNVEITTSGLLVKDGAVVNVSTQGKGKGGSLIVNASKEVQLIGTSADGQFVSALAATTSGKGDGGNVEVTAPQLLIKDGANVNVSTQGEGKGGSLIVNASQGVQLIGTAADGQFSSGLFAVTEGTGDGGNVKITTPGLLVTDGAAVNVSTYGEGKGGNLIVNASQAVQLIGTSANGQFVSALAAETSGKGIGGNVEITTPGLLVTDGAKVSAATFSQGKGGSLIINASEQVQLSGTGGLFVNATAGGTAGDLIVNTHKMSVTNGAQVSVSSPQGQAGNLNITANSLTLKRGTISAETAKSGAEGGANITLKGLDLLRMDNESLISATALQDANGGNVTIDSTFIVATPPKGPEGSDIIANADRGNGGQVNITTQGLFGIKFRPKRTPQNDITASSNFGVAGVVQVNGPTVDPSRGLGELPANLVDASRQIDRRCKSGSAQRNSFTITGHGGIPQGPNDVLQGESVITPNWVTLDSNAENNTPPAPTTPRSSAPKQLVEAQGWMINEQGQVVLTASAPTANPQAEWLPEPNCNPPQN